MGILVFHHKDKNITPIVSSLTKNGYRVIATSNILDAEFLIKKGLDEFKIDTVIVIKELTHILSGNGIAIWAAVKKEIFFNKNIYPSIEQIVFIKTIAGDIQNNKTIQQIILNMPKME